MNNEPQGLAKEVVWNGTRYPIQWKARSGGGGAWVDNWFSNMRPCSEPILWQGTRFASVEHAYQSAKYTDPDKIRRIRGSVRPEGAKMFSRQWPLETPNWNERKLAVMWEISVQRWGMPNEKAELLKHPEPIVEFNNWAGAYWGVVIRPTGEVLGGANYLGLMITEIRRQMLEAPDRVPQITPQFQMPIQTALL